MSEAFDPFNVTDADDLFTATVSPKPAPAAQVKTRLRSFKTKPHHGQYIAGDKSPPRNVLPKMDVKLKLHEEVSSKTVPGIGEDGTVELFVEGKVVVSSLHIRFNTQYDYLRMHIIMLCSTALNKLAYLLYVFFE